ncbi:MAG TPA: AsmA family protein, partial [Dehalococcoidia bacterium]|nr:AsmA family protein [Dehalococcoidia bacterium]
MTLSGCGTLAKQRFRLYIVLTLSTDQTQEVAINKAMARLLRYLGILLLTLAALLALVFFYPPILIAPVESYLSGFLGREFRISIELSVGADHTEIVVGGLEIVNPEWSMYPYLLKISDLTVTLDSKHLLSGSVFVTNLVVEGVEIGLERLDPDTASWSLPVNNESSNESAAGPGFPFHINSVELLDLQIRYADFVLSKPLIINIQSLRDVNPANDFFDFELKALVNEIPLDATGSIAPSLISGKEIEFKLDLILRRLSFHGRGSIADLNNIATLDSSWQVEIPDIADLLQTMGYSRFTDGDTKLVVETRYIDGKNQITATGNIGQFSLDTTALVSDFNEFKHVNLD